MGAGESGDVRPGGRERTGPADTWRQIEGERRRLSGGKRCTPPLPSVGQKKEKK